jgi:hypothetical protein
MKPIDQTIFGFPDGNCFAACIASLLELPIEEVPINSGGDDWLPSTQAFLKTKGLFFLEIRLDVAVKYPLYELFDVWCLYYGKSPRGNWSHSIVGKLDMDNGFPHFKYIHDPHPDKTYLEGEVKGIGFLVPLNPAINHQLI